MNTTRHPLCLAFCTALCLFLWSTGASAAENEPPPPPDPVKLQLEQMAQDLKAIKNALDTLNGLQLGVRLKGAEEEILSLREQMLRLEARVAQNEQRIQGTSERIARSLDVGQETATVRVVNRSGIRASVFLNDSSYDVEPFQTVNIPGMPVGQVTYQVLVDGYGTIHTRTSNLLGGETRTLTINPPR
jgi:hypothetical protein